MSEYRALCLKKGDLRILTQKCRFNFKTTNTGNIICIPYVSTEQACCHRLVCAVAKDALSFLLRGRCRKNIPSSGCASLQGGLACCRSCGLCGCKACSTAFRPPSSQHMHWPRLGEGLLLELGFMLLGKFGTGELVLVKGLLGGTDRVEANVALVATKLMLALEMTSHVVSFVSDMLAQATS